MANLKRWFEEIKARPAAVRANALKDAFAFKAEMDDDARRYMIPHLRPVFCLVQRSHFYAEIVDFSAVDLTVARKGASPIISLASDDVAGSIPISRIIRTNRSTS